MFHSLTLFLGCKTAAGSHASWKAHCRLDLWLAHESEPCSLGKGGFGGTLAIFGFCDVDGLDDGVVFIGSPVADAALEDGAAT